MSPMAKMPGTEVSNFSVSTVIRLSLRLQAPLGDRPEFHGQAEERQQARCTAPSISPSGPRFDGR